MNYNELRDNLVKNLQKLYDNTTVSLPFHGWHHIDFVSKKAEEFSLDLGANPDLSFISALVHDLNYIVDKKSNVEVGANLREEVLIKSGFSSEDIKNIENIVTSASLTNRSKNIGLEAKALSDGDTLYKCLPITPILLARKYLEETDTPLKLLAKNIIDQQKPLIDSDEYFYSRSAKLLYKKWAKTNIELWENLLESLNDKDISTLAKEALQVN